MHLLLPLLASILFVCALILIKRVGDHGVSSITILFLANVIAMFVFAPLWLMGGTMQPLSMLWQPFVVSLLYLSGLTFTFLAVDRGDVSVATPVFGMKVFLVAVLLTVIAKEDLPRSVWFAAIMATIGIGAIQWTGRLQANRVLFTIVLALAAATSFATFDVLVQTWAPAWGAGRFLPILFGFIGVLSFVLVPWVQWSKLRDPKICRMLIPGTTLIAFQAMCIVVAVGFFGDAARANVVYALRGLWGVALAWAAAKIWGGAEAELPRSALLMRLVGAGLLTAGVIVAILAQSV